MRSISVDSLRLNAGADAPQGWCSPRYSQVRLPFAKQVKDRPRVRTAETMSLLWPARCPMTRQGPGPAFWMRTVFGALPLPMWHRTSSSVTEGSAFRNVTGKRSPGDAFAVDSGFGLAGFFSTWGGVGVTTGGGASAV